VGQTAPILSSTGSSPAFVEGDSSEAKAIAEATIGSLDLAESLLNQTRTPDNMVPFPSSLVESIDLYSSAAKLQLDLQTSEEYDPFAFQVSFQAAGAKYHEASWLFSSIQK